MAFGAKIKLIADKSNPQALAKSIQSAVNNATKNNSIVLTNIAFSFNKDVGNELIRQLQHSLSSSDKLTIHVGKIDATEAVKQVQEQLREMVSGLSLTGFKEVVGADGKKISINTDLSKASVQAQRLKTAIANIDKTFNNVISKLSDSDSVTSLTGQYTALKDKINEAQQSEDRRTDDAIKGIEAEVAALSVLANQERKREADARAAENATRSQSERRAKAAESESDMLTRLQTKATRLQMQLTKYKSTNNRGYDTYALDFDYIDEELKRVYAGMANGTISIEAAGKRIKELDERFLNLKSTIRNAGLEGQSFGKKLSETFKRLTGWSIATKAVMGAWKALKTTYDTVVTLDKAIVNLSMVTGQNRIKTKELMDTYIQMGRELGATGAEVANSANEWLRQGYSASETNELIEATMVLSKVGMLESAEATQYLTSAIKAYKIDVADAMSIVDKMSAVDMSAAVSTAGLAEAMSKTANSARIAGVSIDRLYGYLAAVAEVTQADPASVGTSFKTLFARMSNVKLGKMEDEDGNDITQEISDAETVLNRVGIALRTSATEFRDFGDVLDDVAAKWSSFSSVEQSTIATAFGGTRQKEQVITLFENYGQALGYMETSANSAGTAMKKYEAYSSGVEASIASLTATFQSFAQHTLDSDIIKWFVDLGDILMSVADILSNLGGFNVLLPFIGNALATKANVGIFRNKTDEDGKVIQTNIFSDIRKASAWVSADSLTKATINEYNSLLESGQITKLLALKNAVSASNQELSIYLNKIDGKQAVLEDFENSINNINSGMDRQSKKAKFLTGLYNFFAGIVIQFAITALDKFDNLLGTTLEEAQTSLNEAKAKWQENSNEIGEINKELSTTQERINELSLKNSLSIVEQEELELLKKTNAELKLRAELLEKARGGLGNKYTEAIIKEFETAKRAGVDTEDKSWIINLLNILTGEFGQNAEVDRFAEESLGVTADYRYQGGLGTKLLLLAKRLELGGDSYDSKTQSYYEFLEYKRGKNKAMKDAIAVYENVSNNIASNLDVSEDDLAKKGAAEAYLANRASALYGYIQELESVGDTASKEYLELVSGYEEIASLLNTEGLFDFVASRPEFKVAAENLKALGDAGELTAEKFAELIVSSSGIREFINHLYTLGLIDLSSIDANVDGVITATEAASASTEGLSIAFSSLVSQFGKTETATNSTTSSFKNASSTYESLTQNIDSLSKAYKEMSSDGQLSAETAFELLSNYGNLANSLEIENGTIKIKLGLLEEELRLKKETQIVSLKAALQEQENALKTAKNIREQAEARYSDVSAAYEQLLVNQLLSNESKQSRYTQAYEQAYEHAYEHAVGFRTHEDKDRHARTVAESVAESTVGVPEQRQGVIDRVNFARNEALGRIQGEIDSAEASILEIQGQIDNTNAQLELIDTLDLSDFSNTSNDPIKVAYEAAIAPLLREKEKYDAGMPWDTSVFSDLEDFYNKWESINNQFYKNSEKHAEEYNDNLVSIFTGRREEQLKRFDEIDRQISNQEHLNEKDPLNADYQSIIDSNRDGKALAHELAEDFRQTMLDEGFELEDINKMDFIVEMQAKWNDYDSAEISAIGDEYQHRLDILEREKERMDAGMSWDKSILADETDYWDKREALARKYYGNCTAYAEELAKEEIEIFEGRKEILDNLISEYQRYVDYRTKEMETIRDEYDIHINQLTAVAEAEKSMYSNLRDVRQIRRDISKELKSNMALSEYLDEDTRKLLFNEDDYNTLSSTLTDIEAEIGDINEWYNRRINSLTEDTWYLEESITQEYERRLAVEQKKYELARNQLDLEKKKLELNNVLNERNIRMLTRNEDGQYEWTYVHDVNKAAEIVGEISEIETEIAEIKKQGAEDAAVAEKESTVAIWKSVQGAIDVGIENLEDSLTTLKDNVDLINTPLRTFAEILQSITTKLGIEMGKEIRDSGSGKNITASNVTSVSSTTTGNPYSNLNAGITLMQQNSNAWHTASEEEKKELAAANQAIGKDLGLTYDSASGKWYKDKEKTIAAYADGALLAEKGLSLVNDGDGLEMIHTSKGDLIPLKGGETIFNASQTKFLYDLSKIGMKGLIGAQTYNSFSGDIVLKDVQNPQQFINALGTYLQKSSFKYK